MSDFTPGPTAFEHVNTEERYCLREYRDFEDDCPGCRLERAAPELYEAAKAVLAARSLADVDAARLLVRSALAKAEGRE